MNSVLITIDHSGLWTPCYQSDSEITAIEYLKNDGLGNRSYQVINLCSYLSCHTEGGDRTVVEKLEASVRKLLLVDQPLRPYLQPGKWQTLKDMQQVRVKMESVRDNYHDEVCHRL